MSNERVSYLYQRDPSFNPRERPRFCKMMKKKLFYNEIAEDEEMENVAPNGSAMSATSSQNSGETEDTSASVFLRLRPLKTTSKHYEAENNLLKVIPVENASTNNKDLTEKHFEFSKIFHTHATQLDVYNQSVHSSIQNGDSLNILTYGTSGSGKTFTMYGRDNEAGLVQRAIAHIFAVNEHIMCASPAVKFEKGNYSMVSPENIDAELAITARYLRDDSISKHTTALNKIQDEHSFQSVNNVWKCAFVWISFAEIYNENVHDLLQINHPNGKRKNLKVISNDGNSYIKDLTTVHVSSVRDAFDVIQYGLQQVNYAATNVNAHSSRSHCILMVNVVHFSYPDHCSVVTYKFCDLAGSERLKKTENVGNRLKEAQKINTSLLVLGRCFDLMFQNQQNKSKEVLPFRESKLTLLLQKSLLGQEKITTIVTMTPKIDFMEENLQVLNFASIAQQIVYKQPKPEPNSRRAARSTRFSWFMNSLQQRDDSDWNDIIAENERLETEVFDLRAEKDALIEMINSFNAEQARREQELRNKLVDEREAQMKTAAEKNQKRMEFLENKAKRQIADLEREIMQLKKQLNQRTDVEVLELDDDSDEEADEDNEDDDDEEDSTNQLQGVSAESTTLEAYDRSDDGESFEKRPCLDSSYQ